MSTGCATGKCGSVLIAALQHLKNSLFDRKTVPCGCNLSLLYLFSHYSTLSLRVYQVGCCCSQRLWRDRKTNPTFLWSTICLSRPASSGSSSNFLHRYLYKALQSNPRLSSNNQSLLKKTLLLAYHNSRK